MSSYDTIPLPTSLALRLQALHRLPQAPPTLGDYVVMLRRAGKAPSSDPSALTCAESPHEIDIGGETRHTYCVFDTFLLSAMAHAPATVRSTSPLSGQIVAFELMPGQVTAEPASAVISYGLLREGEGQVCDILCPYVNAFASMDDYERWAAATPGATTVALSAAQALEFARDFVDAGECC